MSIDRGLIDQQLQALGEGPGWWEHREMRDLPLVMHADERILAIARGHLSRLGRVRRPWLILVTERRLLCLRSAGGSGWRQVDVSGSQIARTALRIGPLRSRVLLAAGGQTYRLTVARQDAYKLSTALTRIGTSAREALPGFRPTLMVRRVIDHVLDLPAAALGPGTHPAPAPAIDASAVDERVHSLEQEVEELRTQLHFLEDLLHRKHAEPETQSLHSG